MAPPVGLEPTVRLRALPSLALAADNALCCRLYASRPLCGFALQNPAQARRFIGVNNKKVGQPFGALLFVCMYDKISFFGRFLRVCRTKK